MAQYHHNLTKLSILVLVAMGPSASTANNDDDDDDINNGFVAVALF